MTDIPGWFGPADEALFNWILEQQTDLGDLAEIGAYLGRSAVVIGAHQLSGETFTVIDLFGDAAPDTSNQQETSTEYPNLTRAAFEENYRAARGTLPVIVQAPSGDLVHHAAHGAHRFVHIDGSHRYNQVAEDIRTARTLLQPEGVVVLDDITAQHTPGVWAATWEAVVTGGMVPFAVSENKLYATWGDYTVWQGRFRANPPEYVGSEKQEVLGRPLLRLWNTRPWPRRSFGTRVRDRARRELNEWRPRKS